LEAIVALELPAHIGQKRKLMRTVGYDLPKDVTYANITTSMARELIDALPFIPPSDAQRVLMAEHGLDVDDMSCKLVSKVLDAMPKITYARNAACFDTKKALLRAIGLPEWPVGVTMANITEAQAQALLRECVLVPPSDEQLIFAAELGLTVPDGISSRQLSKLLDKTQVESDLKTDEAKRAIIAANPALKAFSTILIGGLPYRIERIYLNRGAWMVCVKVIRDVQEKLAGTCTYESITAIPIAYLADAKPTNVKDFIEEHFKEDATTSH
jgi:hypothetical protein